MASTHQRDPDALADPQAPSRAPWPPFIVIRPTSTVSQWPAVQPPTCMIREFEVFSLRSPSRLIGRPARRKWANLVADLVRTINTILMANHGVVAWSHNNVEDAYFKMEILEALLPHPCWWPRNWANRPNSITPAQLQDCSRSSKAWAYLTRALASRNVSCATTTSGVQE